MYVHVQTGFQRHVLLFQMAILKGGEDTYLVTKMCRFIWSPSVHVGFDDRFADCISHRSVNPLKTE